MAAIGLTRGYVALVDDKLFFELNAYAWYASGPDDKVYAARRMKDHEAYPRSLIYMHHQVLGVYPKELNGAEVDHDNRNRLDNRLANLTIVTHLENMQAYSRKSDRKGVSYDNNNGKWKAYIDSIGEVPKTRINIGTFATEAEAVAARTTALAALGMTR